MTKAFPFEPFVERASYEQHCCDYADEFIAAPSGTRALFSESGFDRSFRYWAAHIAHYARLGKELISLDEWPNAVGILCVSICHHPLVRFEAKTGVECLMRLDERKLLLDYPTQYLAVDIALFETLVCRAHFYPDEPELDLAVVMPFGNRRRACEQLATSPNAGMNFLAFLDL